MVELYKLEREMIFAKANGKKLKYLCYNIKYKRLKKKLEKRRII